MKADNQSNPVKIVPEGRLTEGALSWEQSIASVRLPKIDPQYSENKFKILDHLPLPDGAKAKLYTTSATDVYLQNLADGKPFSSNPDYLKNYKIDGRIQKYSCHVGISDYVHFAANYSYIGSDEKLFARDKADPSNREQTFMCTIANSELVRAVFNAKEVSHDHVPGAFAYIKFYYLEDTNTYLIREIQSDAYRSIDNSETRAKYQNWSQNILLAFEDMALRKSTDAESGPPRILICDGNYQQQFWAKISKNLANHVYENIPASLGYKKIECSIRIPSLLSCLSSQDNILRSAWELRGGTLPPRKENIRQMFRSSMTHINLDKFEIISGKIQEIKEAKSKVSEFHARLEVAQSLKNQILRYFDSGIILAIPENSSLVGFKREPLDKMEFMTESMIETWKILVSHPSLGSIRPLMTPDAILKSNSTEVHSDNFYFQGDKLSNRNYFLKQRQTIVSEGDDIDLEESVYSIDNLANRCEFLTLLRIHDLYRQVYKEESLPPIEIPIDIGYLSEEQITDTSKNSDSDSLRIASSKIQKLSNLFNRKEARIILRKIQKSPFPCSKLDALIDNDTDAARSKSIAIISDFFVNNNLMELVEPAINSINNKTHTAFFNENLSKILEQIELVQRIAYKFCGFIDGLNLYHTGKESFVLLQDKGNLSVAGEFLIPLNILYPVLSGNRYYQLSQGYTKTQESLRDSTARDKKVENLNINFQVLRKAFLKLAGDEKYEDSASSILAELQPDLKGVYLESYEGSSRFVIKEGPL